MWEMIGDIWGRIEPRLRAALGPLILVLTIVAVRVQMMAPPPDSSPLLPPAGPDALFAPSSDTLYGVLRRESLTEPTPTPRPRAGAEYRQGADYEQATFPTVRPDVAQKFLSRWLLMTLAVALALVIAAHPRRALEWLRDAIAQPEPAINLAVFRALVFALPWGLWFSTPSLFLDTYLYAPVEIQNFSYGWLPDPKVLGTDTCLALTRLFLGACALASLGLLTRATTVLATLLGLYVLGIPSLFHGGLVCHLVWFFALLSVSRCADTFSLDACLRRAGPDQGCGVVYGAPLRLAGLLLGSIVLMPGFWKVWMSGVQWGTAENLSSWMYYYWHIEHKVPLLRLDLVPWVCGLCALGVLAIQLAEVGFLLIERLRVVGALLMASILAAITVYMVACFWNLLACVTLVADWSWLTRRPAAPPDSSAPLPRAPVIVTTVILAANLWCGLTFSQRTWPFSMYPSFANLLPPVKVQVTLVPREGARAGWRLPLASGRFFNSARWEVYVRELDRMSLDERRHTLERLVLMARGGSLSVLQAPPGSRLDCMVELIWTAPERRAWPPLQSYRLGDMSSPRLAPRAEAEERGR